MSRPASAWAIRAPDWASPPHWLHEGCVRRTRAEAIDAFCHALGVGRPKGWKHLYGRGWRAVRVTVVLSGLEGALPGWKRVFSLSDQARLDANAAAPGSKARAYLAGKIAAFDEVVDLCCAVPVS